MSCVFETIKRALLCVGDTYWCALWKEILSQVAPDVCLISCPTLESEEKLWISKRVLVRLYQAENRCFWEDWTSIKTYLLPEFFSVFLGEIKKLENDVGYTSQHFSLYQNTIITENNQHVILREKEYVALVYFIQRYEKKIDKEELLCKIWKYHEGIETSTLETHITQLNKKLALCAHRIVREQGSYILIPLCV